MFSLENMNKDITLAHDEMSQSGISLKMLTLAQGLYAQGVREGIG
jgi:3-hydroxyisobutyrate dehydrogenase-like beta-hydroxyacid dehydrogenase